MNTLVTRLLHLVLFSAMRFRAEASFRIHCVTFSICDLRGRPYLLAPPTAPCRIVFARGLRRMMWPNQLSLRLLTMLRRGSCLPVSSSILVLIYSFVSRSLLLFEGFFCMLSSRKLGSFFLCLLLMPNFHSHSERWRGLVQIDLNLHGTWYRLSAPRS